MPHPQRYTIGKPAELWKSEHYEKFGIHSFLPLNQIISRCAHGIMHQNGENLLVVIPLMYLSSYSYLLYLSFKCNHFLLKKLNVPIHIYVLISIAIANIVTYIHS